MIAAVQVLSAGAIEPGLIMAAEAFRRETGQDVKIAWATTPAIRQRVGAGGGADVLVVPPEVADDFARAGKVAADERAYLGRVGIGVVIRNDAPVPDVSSVEALRCAVLDADSVVFNCASSGLYIERLFARLGLLESIRGKTTRYANGPQMMEHVIRGRGSEIAFGAVVEILMFRDRGLKLAAPLPAEVQHYTGYAAVPMNAARNAAGARIFVRFLATPVAKALFVAHGIE